MDKKDIKQSILDRLSIHEECFSGLDFPLLKISECYPGLWMEHIYDSVFYAKMHPEKLYLAENAINAFIDLQLEDGQLPFMIQAKNETNPQARYSQIQECVSFGSLAYSVYEMNGDKQFLMKAFAAVKKWIGWLKAKRMTRGTGLVEMFFGYDTGHDHSARVIDLAVPGLYTVNGVRMNAATLPPDDNITPVIAIDMNCNFYGNLKALEKMAAELGLDGEEFKNEAKEVKKRIFDICFDKDDCFFYDVDRHGNKRKILSSAVLHLFIEGVLDKNEDAAIIKELCERYIFNEKHFYAPYPFPSVSISDPTWKKHTPSNCWGYFTQTLIILRCTLWMEKYGFNGEFEHVSERFLSAWLRCYDRLKLGQELDPITGEPSDCSEWYSSCMLMVLYLLSK